MSTDLEEGTSSNWVKPKPEDTLWKAVGSDGTVFLELKANGNLYYRGDMIAFDQQMAKEFEITVQRMYEQTLVMRRAYRSKEFDAMYGTDTDTG